MPQAASLARGQAPDLEFSVQDPKRSSTRRWCRAFAAIASHPGARSRNHGERPRLEALGCGTRNRNSGALGSTGTELSRHPTPSPANISSRRFGSDMEYRLQKARRTLVILASLCLCPQGKAQRPPSSASEPWSPPASLTAAQRQATRGPETAVDGPHIYTLPELVDLAEQHNPSTRVAWEAAKVRAGQLRIARGDLLPTLTAVAMGGTTRQGILFGTTFVRQTIGYYEPILRVSYLVFDFGERSGRIQAARDQLVAANFAFNTAILDVLFETERRYYAVLRASGQRTAAEINLRNAQTVRDAVEARLAVGLSTLPDALEARAAAAQADFELQAAIGQVDTARGDLLSFLGASPAEPLNVQPLEQLHLPETLDQDVHGAMERSLAQRPEFGQQVAQKQAAEAALKQARSAFLPSLTFQGYGGEVRAYGQQDLLPGTYAGPLQIWDTSLQLRWDVFDGGRREGELARAHAEQRRAQAEIDHTRDIVEEQVWNAYVAVRTAFHERDAAAALLIAARTSYDAAVKSYQLGVRNTVDVVSAQRALAQALNADVNARTDLLTQFANFRYRTGDMLQAAAGKTHP